MRRVAAWLVAMCALLGLSGCGGNPQSTVALSVEVDGHGIVTPGGKAACGNGTTVEFTCSPAPGWVFDRWEGPQGNDVAGVSLTMDGPKSVTAVFAKRKPDYAGVEVGREWTYSRSSDGKEYTVAVLSKRLMGPGEAEFRYGPKSGWVVRVDGHGYRVTGDWSDGKSNPYPNALPPLLEMPITAGSQGMMGCTAVEEESVTVPAGTFKAWRYQDPGPTPQLVAWFAPHVGWVRIVTPAGADELVSVR